MENTDINIYILEVLQEEKKKPEGINNVKND